MSIQFGGKAYLCDGCGSMICERDPVVGAQSRVYPGGATTLTLEGWDDNGPGSIPRTTGESHVVLFVRHYCPTCNEVAEDRLKEAFPRLPLVDNLAEHV